jgi:hypothetical protein
MRTGLGRQLLGRVGYELWRLRVLAAGASSFQSVNRLLAHDGAAWTAARLASSGPIVLLVVSPGRQTMTLMNGVLAMALTLRGARVHLLVCDRVLPACEQMGYTARGDATRLTTHGPDRRVMCWNCYVPRQRFFAALGLPMLTYGALLAPDATRHHGAREEDDRQAVDDLDLDEHARAGTIRYFKRADLTGEEAAGEVLETFTRSGALMARIARRAIAEVRPDVAVFHHGIYVPFGVVGSACRAAGVRVVNWHFGYPLDSFVFSHTRTYHLTMLHEPASSWDRMPWTPERREAIQTYLDSRRQGTRDGISYARGFREDGGDVAAAVDVDRTRPIYTLFTNVAWDAQLNFTSNAFLTQVAWLRFTLEWFARRPDLQLVIRVHPAEAGHGTSTRQPLEEEVRRAMPTLPAHIRLVPANSPISSYALAAISDAVLIYQTTVGIEVAAAGVPVIVAGEAWVRGKDISWDAGSPEEYQALLERLPIGRRLDEATQERALRYAYHVFLRRMIPVRSVTQDPAGRRLTDLTIARLADLQPGVDPGLDVICDGILTGRPFVADRDIDDEAEARAAATSASAGGRW